jgi:hypothetical protein
LFWLSPAGEVKDTAGYDSRPEEHANSKAENREGVPRELEEVFVRVKDASRDGRQRARDGVMMILHSRRLEAVHGRMDGQLPRNALARRTW